MLHRCRSFLTSFSLLLLTGLVPLSVSAQVPHDMAYQGVLTDAVGAPLTGPVTLVFRVFGQPSGGAPLYTETHSDVAIDPMEGAFLVQLGLERRTSTRMATGQLRPTCMRSTHHSSRTVRTDTWRSRWGRA